MRIPKIDGYISVKEAAEKFQASNETIRFWVQSGNLDGFPKLIGGKRVYYIKKDSEPLKRSKGGRPTTGDEPYPKCPIRDCLFAIKGRCPGLYPAAYKKGKGCSFYKPMGGNQ